jgi:mono/diheme cytochrome c family protein
MGTRWAATALLCLVLAACQSSRPSGPFTESATLGGQTVEADTLNHGVRFYALHCAGCHGATGNGKGAVGVRQIPAPRDLRLGVIKFGGVRAGELPTDADLRRILEKGLRGTGMLPWRFRDAEFNAVIQYIKTLSPRWRRENPGVPVVAGADPWGSNVSAALDRGRALYHGDANCSRCHPAYDPAAPAVRPSPGEGVTTDSLFGPLTAPDLRQAPRRAGDTPADLYRVIAAGIGGTGMPALGDVLDAADVWALVHYVESLAPTRS